jgi:dTDP-4-amino-4,6-dideoxygalactose transaminase
VKKIVDDLAFFSGKAAFDDPLHVAQLNLPLWEEMELVFRGIFERRFFTNHGPLVRELDQCFASFVGAEHAVCVTNGTVALMILARSLDLSGEVIVPAFTFPATVQALSWAGLTPVLCDVDPKTHMISPDTVAPHITPRTSGILGVHVWGRPCEPERLESFSTELGLVLFFDACHGVGCSYNGCRIGNFGVGEAFSFHATKILNGGEGGCITTNNAQLAAKLRTMRSFHPSETFAQVPLRMNGKMSEAQAGLALLSMIEYPKNVAGNRRRYDAYRYRLSDVPGVSLLEFNSAYENNYQYIVIEIDQERAGLHRDVFLNLLSAENVLCRRHFYPGIHRMLPYSNMPTAIGNFPGTNRLCDRLLQLPNSQTMTEADVDRICNLIRNIQQLAEPIRSKMVQFS